MVTQQVLRFAIPISKTCPRISTLFLRVSLSSRSWRTELEGETPFHTSSAPDFHLDLYYLLCVQEVVTHSI